ncbi:uncharacterized protein LOC131428788 [Malaya genurostris]|uniref:uncharacterized protein LOC131428788 n=1 Tax=Malaya genurostris TaxID=325434 RepID=UPI0026F40820|nr:uncharacterized protein LOC131428788 [Malaya genurostris]
MRLLFLNSQKRDPNVESYVLQSICGNRDVSQMVCCPGLRFSQQTTTTSTSSGMFFFSSNVQPSRATDAPILSSTVSQQTGQQYKLPTNPIDRCGMSNASHARVVGGVDAQLGAWPWVAALGYRSNSFDLTAGPKFLCGGTLITIRHVLSAAHCIQNLLYFVRLGEYDITSDNDGANPVDIYVDRTFIHEQYNEKTIQNDVALIRLQRNVPLSDSIKPICLPVEEAIRSFDLTYYSPFVAGWGTTTFRGPTANRLQEVQVIVLPTDQCAFNYKLYFPDQIFDDKVLCAGFPQGGKDACQGDSGGPLMLPQRSSNGQYYYYNLIGIVSYGYECAKAGFPGVYVKVSVYIPWIESKLNLSQSCYTPNGLIGVCQSLQYCPSLVRLYERNRSRQTINFLVASQRNCGNRAYGGYPVLCCTDGVEYEQNPSTSSPFFEVTTTTTTTTTTPRPTTFAPITSAPVRLADCIGPDNREGYCISLRSCPSLLSEFLQRQKDPQYVRYIQQSNAICNYIQPNVCCPLETSVTSAPNTPPPTAAPPTPPAPITEGPPVPKNNDVIRLPTPSDGCGYSKVEHTRVVGGVPAALNGWPWMALIGYKNTLGEVSFKCGGSLITKRHVLTAAHCIRKDLSSVRLGEHDTSTDTETNHIDIPVVKIETYPQYDKKDGHSDLAVLYLGQDVSFSDAIRPICLPIGDPVRSRNLEGLTPFVAGWGRTQEGGKSATVLQELQIPIISNTQCQGLYAKIGKSFSTKQFDNAVLCAGVLEGGQDSCQGDSGGPLMMPQRRGVDFDYYQVGIVSYGIGCARAEVPGVYTRVTTFVDWIEQKVSEPV